MPDQHIKEQAEERVPGGIIVPLDLPEFHLPAQHWTPEGGLSIQVIAVSPNALCPDSQHQCDKLHDCRARAKQDVSLRGYSVTLVILKWRFACSNCAKTFTEPDVSCGRRRRTTARLREAIGGQVAREPVEQVAHHFEVGPRFVRDCLKGLGGPVLEK